ncbi:pseudouridine synthase [Intrasporangium sp.]|uniref:pseudouridine synthase n=1 Tax=Intrasporangium sp. TaxID=1925024 RepID=UPI0032219D17
MKEHHSRSPRRPRGSEPGRDPARGRGPRPRPGGGRADGVPVVDVHDPGGVRLQKLLAAAGIGSRRVCEHLIAEGRVEVDGQVVTELGVRIDPKRQVVHVDGDRVNLDEERVYLAFNKPKGVVTTMSDELGRPSITDYLGNRGDRLFHVGRLDADTEGLLLLTNDGDLAHRLQHPAYGVAKTYLAQIQGPVPRDLGRRLREGIELEDGPAAVDSFRVVDSRPGKALVELVLHEGRKHVVRRMLAATGHPVQSLVRTEVGPIRLADLRSGRTRRLGRAEVAALYKAAGL